MSQTIGAAGVSLITLSIKTLSYQGAFVGLMMCVVSAGMLWFRKELKVADYKNRK